MERDELVRAAEEAQTRAMEAKRVSHAVTETATEE